jgi:hypothetical protein
MLRMIAFDTPLPWEQALDMLDAKGLLPTHLSSREIREQWGADLRARSLFSARTAKAEVLQGYRAQLADLLDGNTNGATARAKIQDMLDGLGYDAERGGFPDMPGEPATAGSLQDLASNGRVDLVLQTNMRQAANAAFRESGQSDYALFAFPAYELVRIYPRTVPRGLRRTKDGMVDDPGQSWPDRWEKIGGDFFDGRMIARKDSPVWDSLGNSGEFDDALDASFPPFAFNSGFGWREVPRAECIALGVISADTDIQGSRASMNEGVKAAAKFDPDFLRAVRADLDTELKDDLLALKGSSNADYLRRAAGL